TVTYKLPCYKFEGMRLFTNKPPCGPKRGHGTTQPRYAVEVHLDKVAHDLAIDPLELRRRNLIEPDTRTVNGLRITSCALGECLEAVAERSGWNEFHTQPSVGADFSRPAPIQQDEYQAEPPVGADLIFILLYRRWARKIGPYGRL